jgi:hypothetical protein
VDPVTVNVDVSLGELRAYVRQEYAAWRSVVDQNQGPR